MKTNPFANTTAAWLGTVSTALASSGAREDNSSVFVWVFLGFCALIVIAQLLPALLVMLGFAKGLKKDETAVTETVQR